MWRTRKCLRNCNNVEDVCTLDIPKYPVHVIDFDKKCSYVYEAKTLRKTIEDKILYSEYMFPLPKDPVNLLTNEALTYGQFLSITGQLKKYGEFSWIIDRFRACNFDLVSMERRFRQQFKIEAIHSHFKRHDENTRETVLDYFNSAADEVELPVGKSDLFTIMVHRRPTHSFVMKWVNLVRDYYLAVELKDVAALFTIVCKKELYIQEVYYLS
jgi:hypothetical protein